MKSYVYVTLQVFLELVPTARQVLPSVGLAPFNFATYYERISSSFLRVKLIVCDHCLETCQLLLLKFPTFNSQTASLTNKFRSQVRKILEKCNTLARVTKGDWVERGENMSLFVVWDSTA